MAIVATIFGILGRFAGKLLTMTLGWASTLLFGRVPRDRQVILAAITFGSVIWAVVAFAVVWPDAGTFLLAFVPVPPWVEEGWVRLAMLAGALGIPLVLGAATLAILKPEARPATARDTALHVLRGYPLAAALSLLLGFLAAIGVARKLSSLLRRWTDAHIPVVVKPGRYRSLAADLDQAISDAGIAVEPRPAPSALVVPGRLLGMVAGAHVRGLVPERLIRLAGRDVEVLVYPSDIAISGRAATVARVQAALASRLTTAEAWLTATAEGQAIEDRLARLAARPNADPEWDADLAWVDRRLATADLPYDEWEVLYRERLQLERDRLAGLRPGDAMPVASGRGDDRRERSWAFARRATSPAVLLRMALAGATAVLISVDVALLIADRRAPPGPGLPR